MEFMEQDIENLANEHYNLAAVAQELNGYDEMNFLLTDDEGKKYIFKIATDEHGYDFLDAQVQIINHLAANNVSKKFQHFILNINGQALTTIERNGTNYYLRMLNNLLRH